MSVNIRARSGHINAGAAALVVVLLTGFVAATFGFGIYLFAQLVPDMRADLGFDYSSVGAITAAGQFGFLASALLAVWLTPRVGGAQVIVGSVAVCGLCLLLLAMSGSIPVVGGLLLIMAGTAATVFVPMVEVVSRVVAHRYRGVALGLISGGTSYGVFLNSVLVPIFTPSGEWRSVWLIVGLGTILLAVIAFLVFRFAGLFRPLADHGPTASGIPAGGAGGRRPWDLFGTRWVLLVWAMTFLTGFSTFPFQNYLAPFLREELGFGIEFTAQVWGAIGLVGMVSGLAVGWLSDRIGLRPAMLLAYACILGSALILALAPTGTRPIVAGVLFSTAFYPIFGLIPAYVSKVAASGPMAVTIFGFANVTQGAGGMLGNSMGGTLASLSGTFLGIYVAIAACAAILMILVVFLPREDRRPTGRGPLKADPIR